LASFYRNGNGVKKDLKEAIRLYKLAADQNNAKAQFELGLIHDNGEGVVKDKIGAARLYQLSADQGNANAQFNLARLYESGKGVKTGHR
jgi:TPR repeat protein